MPTYEYECTRCGEITSEFKPMSAPRRQRCPHCRGKVELLISGGLGIVFKGDGFYVNDSRKSARPGASRPAADGPGAGKGPDVAGKGAGEAAAAGKGDAKQGASPSGTVHDTGKGPGNKD